MMSPAELRQLTEELFRKANDPAHPRTDAYRRSAERFRTAVNAMFTPGPNGKEPTFDRGALDTLFTHLHGMRSELWKGADTDDLHLFLDLRQDEDRIGEMVRLFAEADASKGKTLPEAVNALTLLKVKPLEAAPVVGDNSSKRYLYEAECADGTTVSGFYTKEESLLPSDPDGVYTNFVRERMQRCPDDAELQDFCQKLLKAPYGAASLIVCMNPKKLYRTHTTKDNIDIRDAYELNALHVFGLTDLPSLDLLAGEPNIEDMLAEFRTMVPSRDIEKYITRIFQYDIGNESVQADRKGIVAGRNVAMSRMANLLGIPELVARSVTMEKDDGFEKETGVLMEEAKGHVMPGDLSKFKTTVFAHLDEDAFRTEALKQVGDLQILDYLCMNVDRHSGNMVYSFDSQKRLTGIIGIDNDLSFGRRKQKDDACVQNGTALDDLFVISESMARSVKRTSPEMIRAALDGTGLQPSEITACCARLRRLQKRIALSEKNPVPANRQKQEGILRIVSDDEWENFRTQMFLPRDPARKNIFTMIGEVEELAYRYPASPRDPIEHHSLRYANTEYRDVLAPDEQNGVLEALRGFSTALAQTEGFFHGSHKEYKTLRENLDTLLKVHFDESRPMTEPERTSYLAKLDAVSDSVNAYITHKTAENDTGKTGTARLAAAKELSAYLGGHLPDIRRAALEKQERELSDIFFAARREEEQLDSVYEALRVKIAEHAPGLAEGDILDSLRQSGAPGGALDGLLNENDTALERCAELAKNDPDTLYRRYTEALQRKNPQPAAEQAENAPQAQKEAPVVEGLRIIQ